MEYYWTDSQLVLEYLMNERRRFHVFVANRVKLIHDYTDVNQWRHVESKDNPADHASRGLTGKKFVECNQWFSGPRFLMQSEDNWPRNSTEEEVDDCDPEVKRDLKVNITNVKERNHILSQLEKGSSSWYRMKRVLAIIMKVIKQKSFRRVDVAVEDLQDAGKLLIKWVQNEAFEDQLKVLKDSDFEEDTRESKKERKKFLRKNDILVQLDPFVDQYGILRVGGRFRKSHLEESIKHPIILPKKGKISRLIVESCHRRVRHQGRGITTNEIRNSGYWILQCNTLVRKAISDCVQCRFLRGRREEQKMANLPSDRMQEVPPFTYCAVDYFGPFYIKEKRKELKRYGCLFTCLTSRAFHIEVSQTLETDSFIMALRRFINIRGNIRQLRSDWGTNFVGAERELRDAIKEMDHDRINRELLNEGADYLVIKWKRNPPSASHMGGIWERQIRSIRAILSALFKVHGTSLNDEALRTFMAEGTGILNSRPLTVDNLNSPDCLPLSPNNLLTMKTKVVLPHPVIFRGLTFIRGSIGAECSI